MLSCSSVHKGCSRDESFDINLWILFITAIIAFSIAIYTVYILNLFSALSHIFAIDDICLQKLKKSKTFKTLCILSAILLFSAFSIFVILWIKWYFNLSASIIGKNLFISNYNDNINKQHNGEGIKGSGALTINYDTLSSSFKYNDITLLLLLSTKFALNEIYYYIFGSYNDNIPEFDVLSERETSYLINVFETNPLYQGQINGFNVSYMNVSVMLQLDNHEYLSEIINNIRYKYKTHYDALLNDCYLSMDDLLILKYDIGRVQGLHFDKNSMDSYWVDFTGIVFLNTFKEDFDGGELEFVSTQSMKVIQPKAGKGILFGADYDYMHRLHPIYGYGARYVLRMWFTRNYQCSLTNAN